MTAGKDKESGVDFSFPSPEPPDTDGEDSDREEAAPADERDDDASVEWPRDDSNDTDTGVSDDDQNTSMAQGDEPEDPNQSSDSADRHRKQPSRPSSELPPGPKLTKKEILSRLLEKNEVILELSKANKKLEAEQQEASEKRLRTLAEFENYRKRTRKEWELLKQQTKAEVLLEILDVVDDFERAFSVAGERDDEFIQGIRLIYNNMVSTLERLGVVRIESLGATFDPNYHMAVAQIDSKDSEPNHVVEVVQQGYLLDDIVIRPAKVIIAK